MPTGVAACLQMAESGKLVPDKDDRKRAKQFNLKKTQADNTRKEKLKELPRIGETAKAKAGPFFPFYIGPILSKVF